MSTIFIYAEVQASVPFEQAPWRTFNQAMKKEPGLIRKTWLSGLDAKTVGGFYEFDTLENARNYIENYLAGEARGVGGESSLAARFFESGVPNQPASRWTRPG